MPENKSEVARLLAKIQTEYESAELGLVGFAQGASQHRFLTAKLERIADLHIELRELVGDEAMILVDNMLKQADPVSISPS
jgi:hypothetical protein